MMAEHDPEQVTGMHASMLHVNSPWHSTFVSSFERILTLQFAESVVTDLKSYVS
jgi:hypothetical protein